jgi:hypothetical protein
VPAESDLLVAERCQRLTQGAGLTVAAHWSESSERLQLAARQKLGAARVNLPEELSYGNHCVVAVSSFGWVIHTAVGSVGGVGGLRTKRSGCSA